MNNSLFVTAASASADALRRFLRLDAPGRQQLSEVAPGAEVDAGAVILNSKVGGGRIGPSSVLVNVNAPSVDVEGCVLINVTSTRPIKGRCGAHPNASPHPNTEPNPNPNPIPHLTYTSP